MSIPRIVIEIDDNYKYTLVAFLVDRDGFLKDVGDIRKRLKITTLPYSFPKFPYQEANNVSDYYHRGVATIYDVSECFKEISAKKHIWLANLDCTLASAVVFAESLLKKYNKNRLYLPVILASILTGCIQNADFSSTRILTVDKKLAQQILDEFEDNEIITTIQVNRESTLSEVENTFRSIQKYYLGTKKPDNNDTIMRFFTDTIPTNKLPTTISNIKRDREWYWMNHKSNPKRLGYQKIAQQYKNISWFVVRAAIKQYQKNLTL